MEIVSLDRWAGHTEDKATYDLIWDVAMKTMQETPEESRLLLAIINQWEQNRRSIPIQVISAAYNLANIYHEIMLEDPELEEVLNSLMPEAS